MECAAFSIAAFVSGGLTVGIAWLIHAMMAVSRNVVRGAATNELCEHIWETRAKSLNRTLLVCSKCGEQQVRRAGMSTIDR